MPIILPDGSHLYDDSNAAELVGGADLLYRQFGLRPRLEHPAYSGYGTIPGTIRYEDSGLPPLIPRAEWPDRIKDMDRIGGWPTNRIGWKCRDQAGTNFCWANGPCAAGEVAAALQNLPHAEWSAASVACPINGYRNQGGWGADAIEYLFKHGAASTDLWPNAEISRINDTNNSQADRANHRVLEWIDVPTDSRAFDALMTCLLLGFACAVGYNWWRHEVCAVRGVQTGPRTFGVEIRNSWTDSWGSKNAHGVGGFSVLAEGKGTPDDCQAVRQVSITTDSGKS